VTDARELASAAWVIVILALFLRGLLQAIYG